MNQFGRIFRMSIYGESHAESIGITIDGVPPGIEINLNDLQSLIDQRKANKLGTTPRIEQDIPIITNGIIDNHTTGAPINMIFQNKNTQSKDYEHLREHPRPGHADFVAAHKFNNFHDIRGGGIFSGRLTLLLVAAGYFAQLITNPIKVHSEIIELHGSANINEEVEKAISLGDSIGGIIETRISDLPIGLGEPFFDSVESIISHLVFSIPGIKAIEFGSGFNSAKIYGSENNDLIIDKNGKTETNNAGGINGGISNGNEIVFCVAVKPTSSIAKGQNTYNFKKEQLDDLVIGGRHDVCFALRVPPILSAVAHIALADLLLIRKTQIL